MPKTKSDLTTYISPQFLYLVRWRDNNRKWKQKCFTSEPEAAPLMLILDQMGGMPGVFCEAGPYRAWFDEGAKSLSHRNKPPGPPAGRFLVKWKTKCGSRMRCFATAEEAISTHRHVWLVESKRGLVYLNPSIHVRLR